MLVKQQWIEVGLLVVLAKVLKLGCAQQLIFLSGRSIFCQFSYLLNVHLLKLIFISNTKISADCFRKSSIQFWIVFVLFGWATDSNIIRIDIEWLEILVDRDAITYLHIVVFYDEVTPLKITVRIVKNDVVAELRNHLLQNKKNFFFIGCETCLSCFGINQIHLIQFLFHIIVVTPKHENKW